MNPPLTGRQRTTVRRLGRFSGVVLAGVIVTGLWELVARPATTGEWIKNGEPPLPTIEPPTAIAWFHWMFGGLAFMTAFFGGAWLWFRLGRVPRAVAVSAVLIAVSFLGGAWVAYEYAQFAGQDPGTDPGYLQFFTNSIEWVSTNAGVKSETEFRIALVLHVVATPVLLMYSWFGIKADQASQEAYSSGSTSWGTPRKLD